MLEQLETEVYNDLKECRRATLLQLRELKNLEDEILEVLREGTWPDLVEE
jgi:hypothetical protein